MYCLESVTLRAQRRGWQVPLGPAEVMAPRLRLTDTVLSETLGACGFYRMDPVTAPLRVVLQLVREFSVTRFVLQQG